MKEESCIKESIKIITIYLTRERAGNQASVQIMVPCITSGPRCAMYNVVSNRSTKDTVKYVTSQDLLHARIIS